MASLGCRVWRRCPHTHHHHHQIHCHHCPLHLHHHHCLHCPLHLHNHQFHGNLQPQVLYSTPLPQNPHLFPPLLVAGSHPNSGFVEFKEPSSSDAQISQELEHIELGDEEEDDEPVFVLTDEWREFFAKSEARRQLERKRGKKGKK